MIGNSVLFGAISMENLDLIVNPKDGTLRVNPLSPDFACSTIKAITYDWYQNTNTKVSQPIARHRKIKDILLKDIIKEPS
uniref:Uncharacterized protein n=1 Tax=Candidatus Kentrum eta TaxID=2126337 RepID=A0A450UUF8_9GAMM|nr:MAG: hypothetical protein BECKH772A_GA0070896_100858 [Candidatus Kentron sp. H]VFJ96184.1 MAG: hypothetical protein BECKH772B_GA0070898_100888 [Candidatus Kentron sp. H]VFK02198.1 MAG: hypothetical protein BECKH772C_GA0070978_100848 [Candidatus Kentron sp. H]